MADPNRKFLPQVDAVIAEFIPICRHLAGEQRYAIAVSGSLGKGTWDTRSDIDFRLYTEEELPSLAERPGLWDEYKAAEKRWKAQGVIIDGIWPRTIGEIKSAIDSWSKGNLHPQPMMWTIWGYYILPDMYHQAIVEDPYGVIAGWKKQLSVYPPRLKQAILKRYLGSLRYWREDYHYAHKVERGDSVFTAGMTAKLVHEVIQILFALNETYFVGDGSNMEFAEKFSLRPPDLSARIRDILYPEPPAALEKQYAGLCRLIDEVFSLAQQ